MYHNNNIVPTIGESFAIECIFTEYVEYALYDDEYIECISRKGRLSLILIFAVYLRMNNIDIVSWDEEMSSIISKSNQIKSIGDEKKDCLSSLLTCLDLYSQGVPIAHLIYCIYPVAKSDFDTLEEFALSAWKCDSIEQIQRLPFKKTSDNLLNKYMAPIFKENWREDDTEGVSMDSMLNVINKGGIGYRVRDIAGLTYLPEFIATTQIGSTKRLLDLFMEQYIRLCYNHVINKDK